MDHLAEPTIRVRQPIGAGTHGAPEPPRVATATIDGVLVVTLDIERHPTFYDPFDHIWLFRAHHSWTLLTVHRAERWTDDGTQAPAGGTARVMVEPLGSTDTVADAVRDRYGHSGWLEVLDAGHHNDPTLFRRWVPTQLERDLRQAVFYRPELAVAANRLGARQLEDARHDVERHLAAAGFHVVAIDPPRRMARKGENLLLAVATVRRYGHQTVVAVRIDDAGEIYARLAEPADAVGPVIREVDDDA